ncbi:MAG: tocopherol cyclase family protein [Chloroflexota bacterium]|nr:tocopherol cyclase family protein [Chloroflexota bacterium]
MLKSITRYVDLTLHPERYHGHDKQPPFFEGWYYKLVSADRQTRYAIIPGIFISDDPARHHAFVQVFDGMTGHATYHLYPASAFEAARGDFYVRVGNNEFRRDHIRLDIADEQRTVQGELHFDGVVSWPVTLPSPGIMGPFGWLPFMECYHGVLGFDHAVSGCLTIDGAAQDFTHGRGYIEKDWGQSFPSGWVWMQTNHFEQPGISLSASNAVIPFMGTSFLGCIVGLWHHGALHQFATYLRSKTERMEIDEQHVRWQITNNSHRLEIIAHRADATPLPGPDKIEMGKRVPETMRSQIEVTLTPLAGGKPVFGGTGECAALEVAGEWERLIV